MSAVDGEVRDRLAKVIYEYTPLMTVIQDAHRIADAILAAGWVGPEQVAEAEKRGRAIGTANATRRFQESMPEAVRQMKESAWNEGAEAFGDSWFDSEPGVVKNPYDRSETP